MSKKLGLMILVMLALTLSLSACVQPASTLPTPTAKNKVKQPQAAATGVGMGMIEIAASQTAAALTNVPLGTPALVINGTATATPPGGIPQIVTPTVTATGASGGATALPSPTPGVVNTALPSQPTVQINKPATYTLKEGEFVYCLARRFNVDPDQILSLNGLTDSETIYAGLTVKIPTSGNFPGSRALKAHPATYTVQTGDTIYSVACLYGDIDPSNIAAVNGLAAPYNLTTGAQIKIP